MKNEIEKDVFTIFKECYGVSEFITEPQTLAQQKFVEKVAKYVEYRSKGNSGLPPQKLDFSQSTNYGQVAKRKRGRPPKAKV